ncbi:polyprenyl synthetase family protein [Nitrospina watsonii]|uniref:Geranyl diphosphate/farnesyl diphosphate synthase n=1 Tax=Nitrospina watsonii TaxID=1323948 RepID=A0ABM9HCE8_9BACT|nr:farnesyl diphosphate synthase [Nitrospina watsonii]CAI2717853.1 geranyl diphosphate/farnesyl diphosphate synthase [Nitrospina watsonii]
MPAEDYLAECKEIIDEAIPLFLPDADTYPVSIHESMHYSLSAGGKRLRPTLLIAAAEAVGGDRNHVLPFAVAAEFLHTYTLIHDDLPALDNDSLRRGKPTNHKVFGEAIAILAGDALLTQAFVLMTNAFLMEAVPHENILRASHEMAQALGSTGVIGGQVVDLESEGKPIEASTLEYIHIYKTGFFFKSCVRVGAILGRADGKQLGALSRFGAHIGLAFQIIDDILDIVGDKATLGKDVGSDVSKNKATYPALFGLEESRKKADSLVEEAISSLGDFDERANPLREIARFFVQRSF